MLYVKQPQQQQQQQQQNEMLAWLAFRQLAEIKCFALTPITMFSYRQ